MLELLIIIGYVNLNNKSYIMIYYSFQKIVSSYVAKFGVKVNYVSEYGENDGQTVLLGFAVLSIEQIKAAV